jgi:transposase InsO family protein
MLFHHLRADGVGVGSASQVWRILAAHGLNTAAKRYAVMGMAMGLEHPDNVFTPAQLHRGGIGRLDASGPGDLVQLDCFQVGRLKESRIGRHRIPGVVWQYTAIDVASSFLWAQLHVTRHNPSPTHTSALAVTVARDLAGWGWVWQKATTDNGNEFIAAEFTATLERLGVTQRRIRAGRPQSNGKVEQVQATILREFWQPIFTTYQEPSISGLRRDLDTYVEYYNQHRPHTGRWNNGQPPAAIITPNTGNQP